MSKRKRNRVLALVLCVMFLFSCGIVNDAQDALEGSPIEGELGCSTLILAS